MRTLRTVLLAGAVILLLLGGLGGVLLAQEEEATPANQPTGPAQFELIEGDSWSSDFVFSDPRMSGRMRYPDETSVTVYVPTGMDVHSRPIRIQNEAGAWVGRQTGYSTDYGAKHYLQGWLVGEGAYEGLSAVFFKEEPGDWHGLIYEGDVPPLWEPPAE